MTLLGFLGCSLNHHVPQHHRVSWNGAQFCGTCAHCGRPIRRISRGNWRLDQGNEPRVR